MTLRCSVVVPTYRRADLLERCLGALMAQSMPADAFEVIIADDADNAATREQVARWAAQGPVTFRYVAVQGNHGPAAARNAGWRAAAGDLIAFTDDDCVPTADWLINGCEALEQSNAEAAWGRLEMPLPTSPTDYELDASHLTEAVFVTANCFCRKRALERIGGFDERFTMAWREDSDLYFTLLEYGCRVIEARTAVVVHPIRPAKWGVSLRQQRKSMFDALLERKHPRLYRQNIPDYPRSYSVIVAAIVLFLFGLVMQSGWLMVIAAIIWLLLTARFTWRRLRSTSKAPAHVAEMVVTSIAIPPLSMFWHWYGRWRFRPGTRSAARQPASTAEFARPVLN